MPQRLLGLQNSVDQDKFESMTAAAFVFLHLSGPTA